MLLRAALAVQIENLKPKFSWDTAGGMVFMQVCNDHGTEAVPWDTATLEILAKHPMVCFEKCQGIYTPGYEEQKVVAARKALKAINPKISCIQYLNSELSFTGYQLDDSLKANTYWLKDIHGKPVYQWGPSFGCKNHQCPKEGLLLPDYSVPEAATFYFSSCANITKSPYVDGCNIDRCNHLGHVDNNPMDCSACADKKQKIAPAMGVQAWNDGKLAALQALQKELGEGPVICNLQAHGAVLPGVNSQNIEVFGPNEKSIKALQFMAAHGKLAKAHWAGKCTDRAKFQDGLAAFLIGAGEDAFFQCGQGWTTGSCLTWHQEYDKPLGTPISDAIEQNGLYTRHFSKGTYVTFDTKGNKGQICWAGESKSVDGRPCHSSPPSPPSPPTPPAPSPPSPPSPPPSPPSPPSPSDCGTCSVCFNPASHKCQDQGAHRPSRPSPAVP